MKKSRGFKLGRKLVRVFRWFLRRKRNPSGYQRLGGRTTTTTTTTSLHCYKSKTMTKIYNWGRCLKKGAKELCLISNNNNNNKSSSAAAGINAYSDHYKRLDQDPFINHHHHHHNKPVSVPKGHLAVYVGDKEDDYHRYLVPVFYFNHPLFGELLREAEKEYGFQHPGGITIPCQISEFENVKTKIAATGGFCRKAMVNHRR